MEATQKRGFFKGKLAKSFSRVTKPRTTLQQCGNSSGSIKVVPCSQSISNGSSAGFFSGQNLENYSKNPMVSTYSYASSNQPSFHEQKNVANLPSSMQKASYASFKPPSFNDQKGYANDTWGHGDENVDFKATSYISSVRERFKLDRVDSAGNKYQEML